MATDDDPKNAPPAPLNNSTFEVHGSALVRRRGRPPTMRTCVKCGTSKNARDFTAGSSHCRACGREQKDSRAAMKLAAFAVRTGAASTGEDLVTPAEMILARVAEKHREETIVQSIVAMLPMRCRCCYRIHCVNEDAFGNPWCEECGMQIGVCGRCWTHAQTFYPERMNNPTPIVPPDVVRRCDGGAPFIDDAGHDFVIPQPMPIGWVEADDDP